MAEVSCSDDSNGTVSKRNLVVMCGDVVHGFDGAGGVAGRLALIVELTAGGYAACCVRECVVAQISSESDLYPIGAMKEIGVGIGNDVL